jgi:hypothetical protein
VNENEKFLAALRGLRRIVDDPSRSRVDRVKARQALNALTCTAGGSVLRLYSGGDRTARPATVEDEGFGEYR